MVIVGKAISSMSWPKLCAWPMSASGGSQASLMAKTEMSKMPITNSDRHIKISTIMEIA